MIAERHVDMNVDAARVGACATNIDRRLRDGHENWEQV
jgi:hypothetical protein